MNKEILQKLAEIEVEKGVRILHACEAGSRAWGFASQDSDYDVRFIYAHPLEWYLRIHPGRDVIECPINADLDICGWDLCKALGLLNKSNPSLIEHLHSPILYRADAEFHEAMRSLAIRAYHPRRCFYHYLHIAQRTRKAYLDGDLVLTKKYFYALRPLLACRWIEQERSLVPVEFAKLIETTISDTTLLRAIDALLERKMAGIESDCEPPDPTLQNFVDSELARYEGFLPESENDDLVPTLDAFFQKIVVQNNFIPTPVNVLPPRVK